MDTTNTDNYNLDSNYPPADFGDNYYGGPDMDYSNFANDYGSGAGMHDLGMWGILGGIGIAFFILFYISIFFLLPIYMMVVTDATLKRKYWWTFGLMFPGINLVTIPIYWFGEFKNRPHFTTTHEK